MLCATAQPKWAGQSPSLRPTVSPAEARTSFLALDQYLRSITSGFQPTPPTHCRHEQIFILLASALIAGVAALFASAAAGLHLEGAHYLA